MGETEELKARLLQIEQALRESHLPNSAREELRNEWEHVKARLDELAKEKE